jgi:hypothetical protein
MIDSGIFRGDLEGKMLVYFMVICNILLPIGIFWCHVVYFVVIWYIFPFWYVVSRKIWQPRRRTAKIRLKSTPCHRKVSFWRTLKMTKSEQSLFWFCLLKQRSWWVSAWLNQHRVVTFRNRQFVWLCPRVLGTGWPDWPNFRLLGDCLLWEFLK